LKYFNKTHEVSYITVMQYVSLIKKTALRGLETQLLHFIYINIYYVSMINGDRRLMMTYVYSVIIQTENENYILFSAQIVDIERCVSASLFQSSGLISSHLANVFFRFSSLLEMSAQNQRYGALLYTIGVLYIMVKLNGNDL